MLALPSGTIPIIAGLSGAGERIPALAHDASSPGSCLSNRPTRNPALASSSAIELPIRPPPAIATSNVFIGRFYRNGWNHGCDTSHESQIGIFKVTQPSLPTRSAPSLQDSALAPSRLRLRPRVLPPKIR